MGDPRIGDPRGVDPGPDENISVIGYGRLRELFTAAALTGILANPDSARRLKSPAQAALTFGREMTDLFFERGTLPR